MSLKGAGPQGSLASSESWPSGRSWPRGAEPQGSLASSESWPSGRPWASREMSLKREPGPRPQKKL